MRLAGQAKGGYYPTPPRVTEYAVTLLQPLPNPKPSTNIRMLDPCCGPGEALAQLADAIRPHTTTPIETYGVELHHERSAEAARNLDNVLSSDIFNTSISNHYFQLLFLNPPYDMDADPDAPRTELSFLTYCTKYLAPYGILIYIIPQNKIHTSAKYLSGQYHSVRVYRFPEPEFSMFSQVVLVATKAPSAYPATWLERSLHKDADDPNLTALSPNAEPDYTLSGAPKSEPIFYSRIGNPIASATEARAHGLWTHPKAVEQLWPPHIEKTRPLMPLRKGHMAMLIAAGFLNNLALQEGGQTILVKGTTTKEEYLAEQDENKTVYRQRIKAVITTLDMTTGEVKEIKA